MKPHPDVRRAVASGLERMRKGKEGYLDVLPLRLVHALAEAPSVDEDELGMTRQFWIAKDLSPREKQVILAASFGLTNKLIGEAYGLAEETIKSHMRRIRLKLGAKDRTHAVAIALRQKQIE